MSILGLDFGISGPCSTILPQKSESVEAVEFIHACTNNESKVWLKELAGNQNIVDIARDQQLSVLNGKAFDAIIVPACFEQTTSSLPAIRRLLKPGGRLGIVAKAENPNGCSDGFREWESMLEANDFTVDFVSFGSQDGCSKMLVVASAPSIEKAIDVREIYVLTRRKISKEQDALITGLTRKLNVMSIVARAVQWTSDFAPVSGATYVSLLEYDEAMLAGLVNDDFARLKAFIVGASNILWVTAFKQPEHALVSGFASTIRNELADLQFRTLHVESESAEEISFALAKLVVSPTKEDEFILRRGILHVSRVVEDRDLNKTINDMLEVDKTEILPLGDIGCPQMLSIGSPGLLDTLYFDKADTSPLGDDEVEVDVKATGLK